MSTRVLLFCERRGRLAPILSSGPQSLNRPSEPLHVSTALRLAGLHSPAVALVESRVTDRACMDTVRRLSGRSPTTRILVRAAPAAPDHIGRLLKAGAAGFLLASRVLPGAPLSLGAASSKTMSPLLRLTPREREVLRLISEGHSTKQIAYRLRLSVKTVETHREHLTTKLGMKSVARLTKLAVREGLTPLHD